jgi:LemA protein
MSVLVVLLLIVLLAVVAAVVYAVTVYNNLVRVKRNVDQAWANIDVLLKQRHDEIPKLIDAVKGYMTYEKDLLQNVTALRTQAAQAGEGQARVQAESQLGAMLGRVLAVAENYPDLKANQSFLSLQSRISALEEQIAHRREFYNDSANINNVRREQVPDMFLVGFVGMPERQLFEAAREERADIDVAGRLSR